MTLFPLWTNPYSMFAHEPAVRRLPSPLGAPTKTWTTYRDVKPLLTSRQRCPSHSSYLRRGPALPAANRVVRRRHGRPPRRALGLTGDFPQLKRPSPSLALVDARRLAPPPYRAALAGNWAVAAAATAGCRCAARRPPLRPNPGAHPLLGELGDLPSPSPTGPAAAPVGIPPEPRRPASRATLRGEASF
jgi:hypothetical protein